MKLPDWKIKPTVIAVFSVSSALSILVGVFYFLSVNRLIKEKIFSELNFVAKSKAEVVEIYAAGFESEARILADVLATDLSRDKPNMEEINRFLSTAASRTSEIAHIDLISPDGIAVASSDPTKIGEDKTQKATYLRGKENLFFNDLHISSGGKKPAFGVSVPVRGGNGTLLGIVLVDVNADKLYAILRENPVFGDRGEIFLINRELALVSPSKYSPGEFMGKKVDVKNAKACSTHEHDEHSLDSLTQLSIYAGPDSTPIIGTHAYLPKRGWCLIAEADAGRFLDAPTRRLMILSGAATFLSLLLLLFVATLIFKIFVGPLQSLHQAMKNVAEGRLSQKINLDSKNEIGELARTLNLMIEKIAGYHRDLENEVKQKTAALSAEMETRKETEKKMEATLEELRQVNKFMTDRELKMADLKKEIEQLKNGRPEA